MSTQPSSPDLVRLFEQMTLIRVFENTITRLFQEQVQHPGSRSPLLGMQILATGQEAVAVGVIAALRPDDVIITNHRSHGHLLAKGADPAALMAEIMGKEAGVNHGKGGTLHLAVPEVNAPMTSTVVGAGPTLAVGAAFAQQYTGSAATTTVFFGDGAAAEGSVHEAMNLAALWKLPLLFVCENNCWAGAQSLGDHCPVGDIVARAQAYDMPGRIVDGNDVQAVAAVSQELTAHCRAGRGPAFIEAKTYRLRGHGEYDHQHYVDKDELAAWTERCPVERLRRELLALGLADETRLADIEAAARTLVAAAVEFADNSPYPLAEAALDHLFANPV